MGDIMRHQAINAVFSFEGRIGRVAFFCYSMIAGFSFYALVIFSIATAGNDRTPLVSAISSAAFIVALILLWPLIAVISKRLHDLNHSAWHGLWLIALWVCAVGDLVPDPASLVITIAAGLTAMCLIAAPGNPDSNIYGQSAN